MPLETGVWRSAGTRGGWLAAIGARTAARTAVGTGARSAAAWIGEWRTPRGTAEPGTSRHLPRMGEVSGGSEVLPCESKIKAVHISGTVRSCSGFHGPFCGWWARSGPSCVTLNSDRSAPLGTPRNACDAREACRHRAQKGPAGTAEPRHLGRCRMRSSTPSQGAPPARSASDSASRRSKSARWSAASGKGSCSHSAAMLSQSSSTTSNRSASKASVVRPEERPSSCRASCRRARSAASPRSGPRHPGGRDSAAAWYLERQRGCSDSEAGRSAIVQFGRDVDELDERAESDQRRTTLRKQDKGRRISRKSPHLLANPMEYREQGGGFLRQRGRGPSAGDGELLALP